MNRTLIGALDALNSLLALLIVAAGFGIGFFMTPDPAGRLVTGVIGAFIGLVVASVVCGLLAIFLEIEQHLRRLIYLRETEMRPGNQSE
ncbi:hypothetical protein J5N58_06970 [Rhizobium cremeum]|uniref:hypothetical protein n=1 Tax=Rhizobium cremeum TaxID=2813827 RepID=UPI001FD631EE|nr:hypothetical protein [Rhizobium cremeum]MCJ7996693.1 hypothetical protein [Rhizobium cremeum]MCJ7999417.1 hypothetical protein [Rhizobium cremeum]